MDWSQKWLERSTSSMESIMCDQVIFSHANQNIIRDHIVKFWSGRDNSEPPQIRISIGLSFWVLSERSWFRVEYFKFIWSNWSLFQDLSHFHCTRYDNPPAMVLCSGCKRDNSFYICVYLGLCDKMCIAVVVSLNKSIQQYSHELMLILHRTVVSYAETQRDPLDIPTSVVLTLR